MIRPLLSCLMLASALATPTILTAVEPLTLAPRESEVIAGIDAPRLISSPAFNLALDHHGREQVTNWVKVMTNLTSVDVMTDLKDVHLFGLIDNEASHVLVVRGKLNEEKLTDLVKLNATYKTATIRGREVSSWVDKGETKFGCFVDEETLVIAGSEPSMDAVLRTLADPSTGFLATEAGRSIPALGREKAFWAALVKTPTVGGDFGRFARATELRYAFMSMNSTEKSGAQVSLLMQPDSASQSERYRRVMDGVLAGAQLYAEEVPMVGELSAATTVTTRPDTGATVMEATLDNKRLLELIQQAREHQK